MTKAEKIHHLERLTQHIIEESIVLFEPIDEEIFNYTLHPKCWSIAQCLNHLNRYSEFYLPKFEAALDKTAHVKYVEKIEALKYSWITKKLMQYILLDENEKPLKKRKAIRGSFQINSDFTKKEFDKFLQNQREILVLLEMIRSNHAFFDKKIKTKYLPIKLKAIDLISIYVHHNYRHFIQAKNTMKEVIVQLN